MQNRFETTLFGRKMVVEIGKYAEQAGGSALVRLGDTVVLVCATVSKTAREGVDFLPLSVEVEEKLYAVGKSGGFIKREASPLKKHFNFKAHRQAFAPAVPKGFTTIFRL